MTHINLADGDLCPDCGSGYTIEVHPDGTTLCAVCGCLFQGVPGD